MRAHDHPPAAAELDRVARVDGLGPVGDDGAGLDLGLADTLPVPDGAAIVMCVLLEARTNRRPSSAATGPRPP